MYICMCIQRENIMHNIYMKETFLFFRDKLLQYIQLFHPYLTITENSPTSVYIRTSLLQPEISVESERMEEIIKPVLQHFQMQKRKKSTKEMLTIFTSQTPHSHSFTDILHIHQQVHTHVHTHTHTHTPLMCILNPKRPSRIVVENKVLANITLACYEAVISVFLS